MKKGQQQRCCSRWTTRARASRRMLREPAASEAFGAFMEKRKPDFSKL